MLGRSSPRVLELYGGTTIPGSDLLDAASGDDLPTKGEVIPAPLAGANWRTAPGARLDPSHQLPRSSAPSGRHPPTSRCNRDRLRIADHYTSPTRDRSGVPLPSRPS